MSLCFVFFVFVRLTWRLLMLCLLRFAYTKPTHLWPDPSGVSVHARF